MRWLLVLVALLLPGLAHAQALATLVADRIEIAAGGQLVAEGGVEVFHEGTRLSAHAIRYDPAHDLLTIEGPIYIVTPEGDVFAADRAELDPRLENGILRGARLVLDERLQLAANRIDRAGGRLTQLSRVAVTSCAVCGTRRPLWEIRSTRVVHDEDAHQLHFENATLRVRGVPVLWLPWMRLPDPTLDRAAGLMVPELRLSSNLGAGLALPVFIPIGASRDLRVTPYASALTRTLETRFRHALLTGSYQIEGAVSDDDLGHDRLRGYLAARGSFRPAPGTQLSFDLIAASDRAYLADYGISDRDRLPSRLSYVHVEADRLASADLALWQSLRTGESSASLPPVVFGATIERRRPLGPGTLTLSAETLAFARLASGTGDDARDVWRLGAGADWRVAGATRGGLVVEGEAGLALQWRQVRDDPAWDDTLVTWRPHLGMTIRYPLVRAGSRYTDTLEPALALGWAPAWGDAVPPEDAARRMIDAGSILSLHRGSGEDRAPAGTSAAALLTWTRSGADGTAALGFGVIADDLRPEPRYLVSASADTAAGFRLMGRALFDQSLDLTETETIIDWHARRYDLSARHLWLAPASDGSSTPGVSEVLAQASWRVSDAWQVSLGGRYDIEGAAPIRADLGLAWSNECVTVDVSLSHRYTEAGTSDPATQLGLSVRLTGFSTGGARIRAAGCAG
ncbi:MAG: LPS-assembly protein LptD [Rubellimicrobium sp.]|nr:LPS-assembly protein LptD [Rubellimicrobium sp.]